MVPVEINVRLTCVKVDYPDWTIEHDQWHTQNRTWRVARQALGLETRCIRLVCNQDGLALLQNRFCYGAADLDRLIGPALPVLREDGSKFQLVILRVLGGEQNSASLRGHNFKEQIEQSLSQFFNAANGIDRGADLHQRAEIARHQEQGVVEFDLQRRTAGNMSIVKLNAGRQRSGVAFVQQKQELRISNAHAIPVLQRSSLNGNVV